MNDLVFNYIECRELGSGVYICKIDIKNNNVGIPVPGDILWLHSEYHGKTSSFEVVNRWFGFDKRRIIMTVKEIK